MAELLLNDEMIEKAKKYISAGNYANVVCQYLGISEVTYYKYINKGEEDIKNNIDSIFVKFIKAIKEAEAEAEMRAVASIQKAGSEGNWTAYAWYLERKHKKRWSQKQEIEHSGNVGVTIKDDI
jgi:hypothetical protein